MKFPNPFKKKKREPVEIPSTRLPEDLETFRTRPAPITGPAGEIPPREYPREYPAPPAGRPPIEGPPMPRPIERPPEERPADRIEMILQKLETIDARLKLIEERLRR